MQNYSPSVMDCREILSTASNLGLLPGTVNKDYVLGWLLAGICNHPTIAVCPIG
jgi:hypothetical protein